MFGPPDFLFFTETTKESLDGLTGLRVEDFKHPFQGMTVGTVIGR